MSLLVKGFLFEVSSVSDSESELSEVEVWLSESSSMSSALMLLSLAPASDPVEAQQIDRRVRCAVEKE